MKWTLMFCLFFFVWVHGTELFSCKDGNGQISLAKVNDGYCDCKDGSDETLTSACAHTKGVFCCPKNFPKKCIPLSQIDDGICDCCNGEDEQGVWAKQGLVCPDRCALEASSFRKEAEAALVAAQEGYDRRTHLIQLGKEKIASQSTDKANAQETVDRLRLEIEQLERDQEDLEEILASLGEEEEDPFSESDRVVDEAYDDMQRLVDEISPPEAQEHVQEEDADVVEHIYIEDVLGLPDVEDTQQEELEVKRTELHTAETSLNEQPSVDASLCASNLALCALLGERFTLSVDEYEYVLEPFVSVKQVHTSLGTWSGWEGDVMMYTQGETCWQGPARSTKVHVKCGLNNLLKDVEEPSRCEYSMVLETPAACDERVLEEAKRNLAPFEAMDVMDDLEHVAI